MHSLTRHAFVRSILFVVVALPATAAAQGDCLDQVYVPIPATNGLEVTASQPVTQTFTCGRDGQLTRIEIALINHHRGMPSHPLVVDIVTTDANGVPTTNSLANVSLPPASVPPVQGPLELDLRSFSIQVTRGQILGLALSSNAAPSTQTYAWWGEAPSSGYTRGEAFIHRTTRLPVWDLAFRSWISSPASFANYGAGHAGSNGVPGLSATANPVIGTSPTVTVGNSLGTPTVGALFLGAARVSVPTPFGGTLLVQVLADLPLQVAASGAQLPIPIPNQHRLCGLSLFFQAVVVDPGASHGIAFTPGMEFVLGG